MEEFLPGSTWIEMKSLFLFLFSCKHLSGRVTGGTDGRLYSWQARWLTGKKIGRWARRVPPFEMDKTQYTRASLSARASLGPGNIDTDMICSTIWTPTLLNVHLHTTRQWPAKGTSTPHPQLPIGIKVTPTALVLSDMRRTREASALISRNSIQAKLMLISARAIGGVW